MILFKYGIYLKIPGIFFNTGIEIQNSLHSKYCRCIGKNIFDLWIKTNRQVFFLSCPDDLLLHFNISSEC